MSCGMPGDLSAPRRRVGASERGRCDADRRERLRPSSSWHSGVWVDSFHVEAHTNSFPAPTRVREEISQNRAAAGVPLPILATRAVRGAPGWRPQRTREKRDAIWWLGGGPKRRAGRRRPNVCPVNRSLVETRSAWKAETQPSGVRKRISPVIFGQKVARVEAGPTDAE